MPPTRDGNTVELTRVAEYSYIALFGRMFEPHVIEIDDQNATPVEASGNELSRGAPPGVAVADQDYMVLQSSLKSAHAKFLDQALQNQLIGRSDEDEPDEQANLRDQHRVHQPGLARHRHDVAVAHRGDADHREVHDVGKGNGAVCVVTQSIAIEPEDGDDDEKQRADDGEPCNEGSPYAALAADEHSSAWHIQAAVQRFRCSRARARGWPHAQPTVSLRACVPQASS